MVDKRFNYENTIGVKIIIRKNDKYFLMRESETNEWMPGKISLPGGKLLLGESVLEALERKIKSEVGFEVVVLGLVKIMNILMPDKNVYHFVFLAEWKNGEIDITKIEGENASWYTREEIQKLTKNDFAEFYNDEILKDTIENNLTLIPMSFLSVQDNRSEEIVNWMERGMLN